MTQREMLWDFIEWARDCGEDALYIFDEPDEAIERFLNHKTLDGWKEEDEE